MKRCNCENSKCQECDGNGTCKNAPSLTIECEYIGAICCACSLFMPVQYLHRITTS